MRAGWSSAVVGAVAVAGLAAGAPKATSVMVLPVAAKAGVNQDLADLTSAAITNHVSKVKGVRAISIAEVEGLMSQEQLKQAAGCDSVSCAVELAGALNADEIIMGNLGKFGASYLLTLSRIRARDATIVGRSMQRIAGLNEDTLLDRLPVAVGELFEVGAHDETAAPVAVADAGTAAPAPVAANRDPGVPPGCARKFVSVLEALRFEKADATGAVRERLPIGTELIVTDTPLHTKAGNFWAVVSGGQGVGGFIAEDVLASTAPSFDLTLQAARAALGNADLVGAAIDGERAAALSPLQREPLELLGAIYDAEANERRARRVRARLKDIRKVEEPRRADEGEAPAPAATEAAAPPPTVGSVVFVAATRLRLRERPDTGSRVLAELRVNTGVKVLAIEGTWARVAWTRSAGRADVASSAILELGSQSAAAPAPVPSGAAANGADVVEGWVSTGFLVFAAVSADALVKEAAALEKAGKRLDAVKRLARAVILLPTDAALLKRLVKLAADERQYATAAFTAVALRNLGLGTLAELRLAYGCRGQLDRVVWSWEGGAAGGDTPDACLERVDPVGRCPPCAPRKPREDPNAERLAAAIASWQKATKTYDAAQKRHQKWAAEHDKELGRLREAFPYGPWLRAEVTGPTDGKLRAQKLFAYALPITLQVERNNAPGLELGKLMVSARDAPWPPAGKRGLVWVHLPDYGASVYGLVAAADAAAARKAIVSRFDGKSPETEGAVAALAPQPNVLGPMMQCGCSGE
ncbi:MAG: hypothetical protein HY904_26410 [Deltaproteobacteria bacterium]|nr:hypothetical protein [Deltaproteobacteria bacterium]